MFPGYKSTQPARPELREAVADRCEVTAWSPLDWRLESPRENTESGPGPEPGVLNWSQLSAGQFTVNDINNSHWRHGWPLIGPGWRQEGGRGAADLAGVGGHTVTVRLSV